MSSDHESSTHYQSDSEFLSPTIEPINPPMVTSRPSSPTPDDGPESNHAQPSDNPITDGKEAVNVFMTSTMEDHEKDHDGPVKPHHDEQLLTNVSMAATDPSTPTPRVAPKQRTSFSPGTVTMLDGDLQTLISDQVESAMAKMFEKFFPMMQHANGDNFHSPQSVTTTHASENQQLEHTNSTVTIPRPLSPNLPTAPPLHTVTTIPTVPTVSPTKSSNHELADIRKQLLELDASLQANKVLATDVHIIDKKANIISNLENNMESQYIAYFHNFNKIPAANYSASEKVQLKNYQKSSFPSANAISNKDEFTAWLKETYFAKLEYYIPDRMFANVIKGAASKSNDFRIIEAAEVAVKYIDTTNSINWQVLFDIVEHLQQKPSIRGLEEQVLGELQSNHYPVTKIASLDCIISPIKENINISQWQYIIKTMLSHIPQPMSQVIATTKNIHVRSVFNEIQITPTENLNKLNYRDAQEFVPIWTSAIADLKRIVCLMTPDEQGAPNVTNPGKTPKPRSKNQNTCKCCGIRFHTVSQCRILKTLIDAKKVKYENDTFLSADGTKTYTLNNNEILLTKYRQDFPKPSMTTSTAGADGNARH